MTSLQYRARLSRAVLILYGSSSVVGVLCREMNTAAFGFKDCEPLSARFYRVFLCFHPSPSLVLCLLAPLPGRATEGQSFCAPTRVEGRRASRASRSVPTGSGGVMEHRCSSRRYPVCIRTLVVCALVGYFPCSYARSLRWLGVLSLRETN